MTIPGSAAYGAMKAAVETLTRYMAKELGARKITANVIAPGAIATYFSGGLVRDNLEVHQRVASMTALGRVGLPETSAARWRCCCRPRAAGSTGSGSRCRAAWGSDRRRQREGATAWAGPASKLAMRGLHLALLAAIAACGSSPSGGGLQPVPDAASTPDAAVSDAAVPLEWPLLRTEGRSAARVLVSATRAVILEETLGALDEVDPGPRRVRSVDRVTLAERVWEPAPTSRIADIAVHPSGAVSLALVDESHAIAVVRLDAELVPVAETPLVDPQAGRDPLQFPGEPEDAGLLANFFTADAVRVAPAGEELVVTVLTFRESVIAYRLRLADGAWTTAWRTLVEPAVILTPFLPIGGSFDTFGAIVAWFRPSLAIDGKGNAYVAVWAGQKRIPAHAMVFGDGVEPLPHEQFRRDSDVLLTKLDAAGARLWTRVIGTANEDEPYAVAAADDEAVVVGRSRRNPGEDNSQWDPWLAAVDGSGALLVSRTLPFDASGIFLGVAVDASGAVLAGGSDGWQQNPEGLSIFTYGAKLLVALPRSDGEPARLAVPAGPRHNEIRSVVSLPGTFWYAGHEDGPLTHSGDGDRAQIHATGVVGAVSATQP